MQSKLITIPCAFCGKPKTLYPCKLRAYNFCSRKCLADFSSKSKNPSGYDQLKSYENMSSNMSSINRRYNKERMTAAVRGKLRIAHLGTGKGKSYEKFYGIHTHRVIAEQVLNRKLEPGEVVHHIDGNRRNNAPENLQIFKSQKEHAHWHGNRKNAMKREVMPK